MFPLNRIIIFLNIICVLSALVALLPAHAAMDPRFELDSQALGISPATSKAPALKSDKRPSRSGTDKSKSAGGGKGIVHTVKPGDNLFKILMRDYGLSNEEADSFIEEIRRENNIYDIKRLKIGQKIIIPPVCRKADGSLKAFQSQKTAYAAYQKGGQTLRLESPVAPLTEQDAANRIRKAWDTILPPAKGDQKPIAIQSSTFSLSLDPVRYPVYAAMNGGRILIDQNSSIPPMVKSLITGNDPSVRIVSESPVNGRHFVAALLESAGFYSVEENFSMDFGSDPTLTVHSDFKVEKTPESLIKQDVLLINSGRSSFPSALSDFLKKEGFSVFEPFGSPKLFNVDSPRNLYQITAKNQPEIVDALLSTLAVTPEKDRRLDVFAADNNGISLSVKADRYFEHGGQRTVVTRFDGDPVVYTLFRILEAKGYQVVILEAQDDFRKVSEKLLSRLRVKSTFSRHTLSSDENVNYSLLMSGIKIEGVGIPKGGIFVTNLELDRIIRTLLTENGYSITTK